MIHKTQFILSFTDSDYIANAYPEVILKKVVPLENYDYSPEDFI